MLDNVIKALLHLLLPSLSLHKLLLEKLHLLSKRLDCGKWVWRGGVLSEMGWTPPCPVPVRPSAGLKLSRSPLARPGSSISSGIWRAGPSGVSVVLLVPPCVCGDLLL